MSVRARAVAAVDEHGEVRERGEDGRADAHGEDGAGRRLAVGGKVQAGDGADAEGVDRGEDFCSRARRLDHGGERERGGDEEERERGGGHARGGVVAAVARAGDERALDEGEREAGVDDFERGAPGGLGGDEGEVERQQFNVVGHFVVGDGLGELVVPDGVGCERGAGVFGEGEPHPAVERG